MGWYELIRASCLIECTIQPKNNTTNNHPSSFPFFSLLLFFFYIFRFPFFLFFFLFLFSLPFPSSPFLSADPLDPFPTARLSLFPAALASPASGSLGHAPQVPALASRTFAKRRERQARWGATSLPPHVRQQQGRRGSTKQGHLDGGSGSSRTAGARPGRGTSTAAAAAHKPPGSGIARGRGRGRRRARPRAASWTTSFVGFFCMEGYGISMDYSFTLDAFVLDDNQTHG